MPSMPYPITAENLGDMRSQVGELIRGLFEDTIGGAEVGDVFTTGNDVLSLRLNDYHPGLEKAGNKLEVKLEPDGGIGRSSQGLYATGKLGGYETGSRQIVAADAESARTDDEQTWVKLKEIYIGRGGIVNVYFQLCIVLSGSTAYGRIYVNGSPVGTERSTTTVWNNWETYTEDITVVETDLIQIYGKSSAAPPSTHHAVVKNFRIRVDNPMNPCVDYEA